MTQDEVKKKVCLYAKNKNIIFENNEIINKITIYITNTNIEYCQKDRLQQLFSLFNGIKIGRGELIYDVKNGKVICTKIKSEIKKFMAIHFTTLKKGFNNQYEIYKFIIKDR